MKKFALLFSLLFALSLSSYAQESFGLANSATGTTLNTLTKVVNTAGAPQAQIVATTDVAGAVGITTLGNGTSGTAIITRSGIAPCVFDNTTVAGDFVQIASGTAGDCHDVGSTRPTSGQIIGVVIQAGGAAGTYNVLLDKSIFPSASGTAPICSAIGSSDTIAFGATIPATFATVCPIPASAITGVGQILEVRVHGVYSASTGTNISNIQISAGGTTGVCQHSGTNSLTASVSNLPWDAVCYLQIVSTGAPGTAIPWGLDSAASTTGGSVNTRIYCNANPCTASTVSFTTNSTQNVTVQLTATIITGQSFTLQSIFVRNY